MKPQKLLHLETMLGQVSKHFSMRFMLNVKYFNSIYVKQETNATIGRLEHVVNQPCCALGERGILPSSGCWTLAYTVVHYLEFARGCATLFRFAIETLCTSRNYLQYFVRVRSCDLYMYDVLTGRPYLTLKLTSFKSTCMYISFLFMLNICKHNNIQVAASVFFFNFSSFIY